MFITYKVKKGETYAKLMKMCRVKDGRLIWNLPQNRKLKNLRKKPEAVKEGDVIILPDPKEKVAIFTYQGRSHAFPMKEWNKAKKILAAKMKSGVYAAARQEFFTLSERHREVAAIGAESRYPLATLICQWWGGVNSDKVDKAMRKANSAIAMLRSAIDSCDFAKVKTALIATEKGLAEYGNAVAEFRNKLISGSKSAYACVRFTRDACFTVAAAAAVTVLAPAGATMGTMMRLGLHVGASAGAIKTAADECGHFLAGNARSWDKITWNMLKSTAAGGISGFLGAGAGKIFCKLFSGLLAKTLMKSDFIRKLILRHGTKKFYGFSPKIMKFLNSKGLGTAYAKDKLEDTLAKFIIRCGVAKVAANLKQRLMADTARLEKAIQKAVQRSSGKETIAEFAGLVGQQMDPDIYFRDTIIDLARSAKNALEDVVDAMMNEKGE